MIDDAVATMAARQAEWDSLRERRVLARVEAEIDRRRAGRRWRWMPLGLVTAAVAVLIIGFAFLSSPTEVDEPPLGGLAVVVEPPLVAASWPAIPTMPAATIALVDGSTATLHDGARIELRTQSSTEIRIEQSLGRVHYDVRPGLSRSFVVEADDVRVVVVGTAFWVTREPQGVRVTVEHGRVRVLRAPGDDNGEPGHDTAAEALAPTIAVLDAGDELRVGVGVPAAPTPTPTPEIERETRPAAAAVKPRKPTAERRSVDELLALADAARGRSDLAAAAAALREIVDHHRDDSRAYGSAFALAKVERSRSRHAAAARAFAEAARRSPGGLQRRPGGLSSLLFHALMTIRSLSSSGTRWQSP